MDSGIYFNQRDAFMIPIIHNQVADHFSVNFWDFLYGYMMDSLTKSSKVFLHSILVDMEVELYA